VKQNQDEVRQAEDGSPNNKSGVVTNIWAPPSEPAYEKGDRVSARIKQKGLSRKVTAKIERCEIKQGKWEYLLAPPAENRWYKEAELDYA